MKFIKINAGGKAEVIELPNKRKINLATMKHYLGFDSPVTVVERKIGNHFYDLWVDDEGLLKSSEERIVSGVCVNGNEVLVGNMLILKHDNAGNSIGLTDKEIKDILMPTHITNTKDYCEFLGEKKQDVRIHGYFDDGYVVLKADAEWLMYHYE